MSWTRLLSTDRLGRTARGETAPVRTAFQKDADRILFSSAFRRLQGKAQVYPLPDDDHVHTRLSHTLEVASVGRSIGNLAGERLLARHPELSRVASFRDFGDCVHAACLAHDLGNPPFGHSGEEAIRTWYRRWLQTPDAEGLLSPEQAQDLCSFEGNAQGFRLICSKEFAGAGGGLQLTFATLGAFTKYPRGAGEPAHRGKSASKLGVFQAEMGAFQQVVAALGLAPRPGMPNAWCRHPLAFLVEAADDICYLILDLEDGHRLGYVPFELFVDLLEPIAARDPRLKPRPLKLPGPAERRAHCGVLRALAINVLVEDVVGAFLEREQDILTGEFDRQLTDVIPGREPLDRIERESIRHCYNAPEVLQVELAGFEVIGALLDKFVPAALGKGGGMEARKLRRLFAWLGRGDTAYQELLEITDYISGMTDSFAVDLYRKLHGISLPGRRG
jgi:dGTPase